MKKIVFLTGTRADYSKIKSLMLKIENSSDFELFIFATGMHMSSKFGLTVQEIEKSGFKNIYKFINHNRYYQMDNALSETINGFSKFVHEIKPDLIVVHGDRVEPLAGAIVGSLNNILVAHIEAGELSGSVDNSLRYAISKLAQIHLVNDETAKNRLLSQGENENSIFIIGSPDLEMMMDNQISLTTTKEYYSIEFDNYAIAMFHPVTTEFATMQHQSREFVDALIASEKNYIVIYPNNDLGFEFIMQEYERLQCLPKFKVFSSLRFEYFITLLKHCDFIIGNSSCILKEALYLNIPGILVGSRQNGRANLEDVINVSADQTEILSAITNLQFSHKYSLNLEVLKSSDIFFNHLNNGDFFQVSTQKVFEKL